MKYSFSWDGLDSFKILINDFYDKTKEVITKKQNKLYSNILNKP